MKKKIYCIYSKADKDSNLYTASSIEECMEVAFQTIMDSEEFDDFFTEDGKIHLTRDNKAMFYDVLKDWQLYCIGLYDSENMEIKELGIQDIVLSDYLKSFSEVVE